MAETKRKTRDGASRKKTKKQKTAIDTTQKDERKRRRGPRLPSSLRKELDRIKPRNGSNSDDEEIIQSDGGNDVYEFEEGVAEEESKKNRRFDRVDNFDYELPEEFEVYLLLSEFQM